MLEHFRPYTNRFHVLTSDFKIPLPSSSFNTSIPPEYRLGQVPQWLNTANTHWTDGNVHLNIKHHADIFNPYIDTVFNRFVPMEITAERILTVACSYAIESQFGQLTDISENL